MNQLQKLQPFVGDTIFVAHYSWMEFEGIIEEGIQLKRIHKTGRVMDARREHQDIPRLRKTIIECKHAFIVEDESTRKRIVDDTTEGTGTKVSENCCLVEIAFNNVKVKRTIHGVQCTFELVGKENREEDGAVILYLERVKEDKKPIIRKNEELENKVREMNKEFDIENERKINEFMEFRRWIEEGKKEIHEVTETIPIEEVKKESLIKKFFKRDK